MYTQLMRPGIGQNESCALGDCLACLRAICDLWSCGPRCLHEHVHHVHSAPQSKEEENREERKKNHTIKQTKMPTA